MSMTMAEAYVRIRPATKLFRSEMQRDMAVTGKTTGRSFGNLFAKAASAAAVAAGIAVIGKKMIDAAEESAKVNRQLAAVIKSTGGVAHVTSGHIDKLASSMMKASAIDDETIKSGQAMLLTFVNIRNEVGKGNDIFDQSSRILLDMTAAMNGGNVTQENMRKQAIQLGKALNDPVRGLTSLRRVGVQFTDQQTEQIKKLAESGHVMEAQKLILRELTREFAGSAAATATPTKKLKVAFGELMEAGGKLLVPILQKLTPVLVTIMDTVSALPGPVKVAGVAIIGLGIAMRLAAAANPWIVLAAAIVTVIAVIIKNWSKIKAFLIASWEAIKRAWSAICGAISKAWNAVIHGLRTAIAWVVNKILGYYGMILHGAAWAFGWIPGIGPKLKAAAKWFDQFRKNVTDSIAGIHGKTVTVGVNLATQKRWKGVGAAAGGLIRGPGGPETDSIPAWLSNGEYVVRSAAVKEYGKPLLDAINAQQYASGGLVVKARTPSKKSIDTDIWSAVKRAANSMASALFSFGGMGGSGVERWRGLVQQVLRMLGQSLSWTNAVLARIRMESGGNPRAINLWDINAQRGDPSRGLMQTIGSTFNAYAGPFRSRGIYDPLANIFAGVNYALHRYGGLWVMTRPGGYGRGGLVSYDRGGRINESIFGIGRSGQAYRFAKGERVEPSAGREVHIHLAINHPVNPRQAGQEIVEYVRAYLGPARSKAAFG